MSRSRLESLLENEFVRFVLMGGVNTGATYGLFALLQIVLPYQVAYTLVYLFGIGLSYWLNATFVFKSTMNMGKAVRYPVVYVVQYALGVVGLTVLVEWLNLHPVLAAPFIIIGVIPVTYTLSRFILKDKTPEPAPSSDG